MDEQAPTPTPTPRELFLKAFKQIQPDCPDFSAEFFANNPDTNPFLAIEKIEQDPYVRAGVEERARRLSHRPATGDGSLPDVDQFWLTIIEQHLKSTRHDRVAKMGHSTSTRQPYRASLAHNEKL